MVSQSADTSCITWLENSTVWPSLFRRRMISRTARVLITSRPLVGSSSSTFFGLWTIARASAVLVRSPCENPATRRSAISVMSSMRQQLLGAPAQVGAGDALQLAEVLDVLARRQPRVEAREIRQHAERKARALRIGDGVDAVDEHLALVRAHQRVEHAQRGGLAGAVRVRAAPVTWPSRAVKLTPSTARTSPNRLWRFSTRIISAALQKASPACPTSLGGSERCRRGIGTCRGDEVRRPRLLVRRSWYRGSAPCRHR